MHESLLTYRKSRFAYIALGAVLFSGFLFITQVAGLQDTLLNIFGGAQVPNGGSWQGYTLGVIALGLVIWLTALGIRKRQYQSTLGSLQGWTSAHVYLGLATLIITTLHSAGQLGWNVHSLAYVLMVIVILSGLVGVYAYMRYPRLLASNKAGRTTDALFAELNELNERGLSIAKLCDPSVMSAVETSIARTALGGSAWAQLSGQDKSRCLLPITTNTEQSQAGLVDNKDQAAVIHFVANAIPRARKKTETSHLQQLLTITCRRQTILRQLRKDIQLRAGLKLWLVIHIPATVALLISLAIHIIAVFFFW